MFDVPVRTVMRGHKMVRTSPDTTVVKAAQLMAAKNVGAVLVTDGDAPAACPVGRAAAELQRDHATRFSWVAVASGPTSAEDVDRIRDSSPVRLDRLYLDRAGRLRETLGSPSLPLLLRGSSRALWRRHDLSRGSVR